jgi:hypothetical protein
VSPILVGVAEAQVWTKRPAGTLRRWVHEGRITRYGTARRALYDLRELPEGSSGDRLVPALRYTIDRSTN